jgi:lipoprotein-anchoring transpeptidase ErfK/SrfK
MRADMNPSTSPLPPSPPGRRGRPRRRVLPSLALLVALALAAGACGGGDDDEAEASDSGETTETTAAEAGGSPTTVAAHVSWVAQARNPTIEVFPEPDAAEPAHVLDNPSEHGAPLVFLVDGQDRDGDWLPVHLPVRPNGSTGFVRAADVEVVQNDYRIVVELAAHQLTVTQAGEPIVEAPIGVGTQDTPTPGGIYYLKELLQPPDPTGPYGTYAYGLSGFSNELTDFNGGDGVIGIHGTNEPESIGSDVSHGCIRVTNEIIDQMAGVLPLGTPVEIRE